MPKGPFKRFRDVFANNVSAAAGTGCLGSGEKEPDFGKALTEEQFQPCKIVRHGFPSKPSALAYDPVQKLLAIGCYNGSIRILGQAGVDCHLPHDTESPIIQLIFLVNQGALISACADDTIHLWNLRQTKPAILHSLKFKRERITYCHVPYQSRWMYVGTERGNTHLCNVETFSLSGYSISWNKAIEISQKTHPGHVVAVCENPVDENKLLISYSSGFVVLWDLKNKSPDQRYYCGHSIRHACWHFEGRQFMCCHQNGSLTVWNWKSSAKPYQEHRPHAKTKSDTCHPIDKVDWLSCRNSDPFIIFSGGLSRNLPPKPAITVVKGKSTTILEVDYSIIDFKALTETPWSTDFQDPTALVILTERELVVIDLEVSGYPSIELGHAMDIHDSPVTCLKYVPDPNTDLIPGLYQVAGGKSHREDNSKKEWPICGGAWSVDDCDGIPEIFVTGHADGSVRFWDASAVFLKSLYKLRTKKIFKKDEDLDVEEEDPLHITHIALCPESRTLVIVNVSSIVVVYKHNLEECHSEVTCLNVTQVRETLGSTENLIDGNNAQGNTQEERKEEPAQLSESNADKTETDAHHDNTAPQLESNDSTQSLPHHAVLLKVKPGPIRQSPGFHAYLACLLLGNEVDTPSNITYLAMNTSYQLLSFGTATSISIIDMLQKTCLFNMSTNALLLSIDKRIHPRSPNKLKSGPSETSQSSFSFDQAPLKSPTDEHHHMVVTKSSEIKSKWGMVAKKSRTARRSIGEYFAKPHSPLSFRRGSLMPKSPLIVEGHRPTTPPPTEHMQSLSLMSTSAPIAASSSEEGASFGGIDDTFLVTFPPEQSVETVGEDQKDKQQEKLKTEPPHDGQGHPVSSSHQSSISQKSVQRDASTTSSTSSSCPPIHRIKKNQHRPHKKTQSFSFEKSLDSTTSADDSVFSRASSLSDTERAMPREVITFITFAFTYTKKHDTMSLPCLWAGTSGGYLFNVIISIPPGCEQRAVQLMVASPSGTFFQMKSSIVYCAFLNSSGQLMSAGAGNWREKCSATHAGGIPTKPETPDSDRVNQTIIDKQFMVLCSERRAKVFTLPSQACLHEVSFPNGAGLVVQATVDTIQHGTYLACYSSHGYILVYGLPSFNLLMESAYLPPNDVRISNTFCFGMNAQAIYMINPTELQRMTFSVDTYESMQEVVGHLFIPRDAPERPNPGFFKGLFGGGFTTLDREELFGEGHSSKASRGVAQHIPGTGGASLEGLRTTSTGLGSDMQRLRMQAQERGEKLGELEDKSQRMHESAIKFSSDAHALMLKYKNKKWYQ